MTYTPPRPCRHPGCNELSRDGTGLCPAHLEVQRDLNRMADARRGTACSRGYGHQWRKARETFLRHNPLCIECQRPATVVDHVVPHRGDQTAFWDRTNWQPMCKRCHDRKTARGE
jgi:5-methylcytosine-specific restriction protein A